MKKLLLISVLLLQIKLYGQAVPNGTFESWNSVPYSDPAGFISGNLRDLQMIGSASVTQVTGYSGSAVRIQTNITGADTSDSYIINTDNPCSEPSEWTGGVPYSQQPTAITGYYRYNLPGNDTALMIVIFRKNGVHIGDNYIQIRGTGSQSTWASFSFPVTCAGVPDSLIFAAASSNKITNQGVQNGSFLELDNLGFAGTTQVFPDATFENWTSKSYDNVPGWEAWGDGVSKSTTSYAGTYAIRLETIGSACGDINSSGITTGHMTSNNGPAGGIPYTNTNDTLCGYYKYTPLGNDTAGIYVSLTNNGTSVGGNNMWLTAASVYTYFELPFQAGIVPDTIRIDVQSSEWPVSISNSGSVLYLDDLYLKSSPLGIFEDRFIKPEIIAFPNPVKDILTISFKNTINSYVTPVVYDVAGQQVDIDDFKIDANHIEMKVENLAPGIYSFEVQTKNGNIRDRFVKQ